MKDMHKMERESITCTQIFNFYKNMKDSIFYIFYNFTYFSFQTIYFKCL